MTDLRRHARHVACCVASVLLVAASHCVPAASAADGSRPNILFLLADDLCFEDIGCMGNDEVETPHLDRLARQGMTFTHAYNMGSWHGAVCMPSRGMLVTGRCLWRFRQVDDTLQQERQAGRIWSEYLRSAGYRTYMAGKWHVRLDPAAAFDVLGTVRPGMPPIVPQQHPHAYNRPREGVADTWDPSDPGEGGFWEGGIHWSEVLADEAIGFLHDGTRGDRPFFMYVAFNAPHDPRQAPRQFLQAYPAERIRVPASFLVEYPFKDAIGCPHELRDEFLAPMPRTPAAVQVHRQEYYAIISHLDAQIGRVLEALQQSGLADNTWVIFTADHGLAVGKHGLLGKQNMYDHSVRAPFIIAGPGAPAGRRTAEPIYYQDIMPTTLALAGIPQPDHVDFQSLLPIIEGTGKSKHDSIYTAYIDLQRAVTKDGWKLVLYPRAKTVRLYHLAEDPEETRDLAADIRHSRRNSELFADLLRWQRDTDDTLDLREAFPELN